MRPATPKHVVVRQSKIHNKGIFAKIDIPKTTRIIEYLGEKISKKESEKRDAAAYRRSRKDSSKGHVYTFELNRKWDIDGDAPYNPAKWINHSCDPNSHVRISKNRIWIVASRKIKKGEEIVFNYEFGLEDYEDHPCKCKAERCAGYIVSENKWPKLKRLLAKKK